MALFSQKTTAKKAKAKTPKKETTKSSSSKSPVTVNLSAVLKTPRVTEKAMKLGEKNVYTFEVARSASKFDVRDAVKKFFGVTPVKINIVNKTPRQYKSRSKGRTLTERGMKKAYVYLKEGDSISLV